MIHNASSVLIFSPLKRFCGYCPSLNCAATLLGCSVALISVACRGQNHSITAKGYYVRLGTLDDAINTPSLLEFDKLHNISARYYKTASIQRKGLRLKYNMIHKQNLPT
jgi:hypothetical protein